MSLRHHSTIFLLCIVVALPGCVQAQPFNLKDIKTYPFPNELTAAATGSRISWAFNEQGKRNVYVAEGPSFNPRKLTNFNNDDGQEITSLSVSDNGKWVVFVRGGDHGSNWESDLPVNTTFNAVPPKVQIWSVPFEGGEAKVIGEGDNPVVSPKNDKVAFVKSGQVWTVAIDGSPAAKNLFTARGSNGSLQWSPDGSKIAFVSSRGDHSIVGIFTDVETPVKWLAPSFTRDRSPKWSPDGSKIVFVRTSGAGGAPDSMLVRRHQPWAICTVDVATGKANQLWKAPATLEGSIPSTHGGTNLHWAANDRITFLSYHDGWPHIYSVGSAGGTPLLLTPGSFMAEHISLSPDKKWLLFSANTGPDKLDIDRRHTLRVPVDKAQMEVLTPGNGMEWTPVITDNGESVAMITTTNQRPPLPTVLSLNSKAMKVLGENLIPAAFPKSLVTPKQVLFKAPDGTTIHAQLFEGAGTAAKKPAILYVHGGPPRQMLLGWNYSDYYANAYSYNQYLASLGFTVMVVNYRLGIGYGYKFHQAEKGGSMGASEYQDVKAAGLWLAAQPSIDASKIGIYGGSYGGYLTAMALAKDSKLFAVGVDIHGVHDRTTPSRSSPAVERYEKAPDEELAKKVTWQSSPVAYVKTWKSPVLIIHGDDDRNVAFSQSTDLVRRLEAQRVPFETMVIVDDTHHWMKHENALKVGEATADFFVRKLK
jgi:dipeptidyl aminopeptidase/acylaminoacyl peptidase